jgi:hypothetical protein
MVLCIGYPAGFGRGWHVPAVFCSLALSSRALSFDYLRFPREAIHGVHRRLPCVQPSERDPTHDLQHKLSIFLIVE